MIVSYRLIYRRLNDFIKLGNICELVLYLIENADLLLRKCLLKLIKLS